MLKLEEVDEVWLALDQSYSAMARDGHHSNQNKLSCWLCYSMYLIERAKIVYKARILV